jgi:HSP20 family protein
MQDVEVLLHDGVLTLRGEKKREHEDGNRHMSERYYGRFERQIPVPPEIDEEKVKASFNKGVLTVTLPKSAETAHEVKRIPIDAK